MFALHKLWLVWLFLRQEASTKLEELLSKKEEGAEDAAEATIQAEAEGSRVRIWLM